jgi:magnesium chelatase family protein
LEVAAAGSHNVMLSGPPGAGKTLLARAVPSILPPMSFEESLTVTKIYSVAGRLPADTPLIRHRPFRAPHHTISFAGLVGGGQVPGPGEISLAHRGVLFLDELPEFGTRLLEMLRQPLEDKQLTIARSAGSLTFPSNFMLIGAMNPCPCGYYGDPVKECTCSPAMVSRYQKRISGPLLDRIDTRSASRSRASSTRSCPTTGWASLRRRFASGWKQRGTPFGRSADASRGLLC